MKITEIASGVHQLSVNVEGILFEGLWDIPNGVTLNSYVVRGEETALIDGVCGWDGVPETLLTLLKDLDVDAKSIKYLVLNHLEPDHAGWIDDFKKVNQTFEVLCTEKGAELYRAFFGEDVTIRVVKTDDTLDLGQGRQLTFKEVPHVHWPDAMVTYDTLSRTLFSCDVFGSFGILEGSPYADDHDPRTLEAYEEDTVRYFSNIVGAFSPFVPKAIDQCKDLDIHVIAPGHGLMWREQAKDIVTRYRDYAHYQKGSARPEITLIWGSMYGMTEEAVQIALEALKESGIKYHVHRVPDASWGDILTSVWTSSGIILGMPTYEYKMFPPMAAALEELGKKKVHGRQAFRFGSYGWSGGAQKELDEIVETYRMKWVFSDPVEFRGKASADELEKIRMTVKEMAQKVLRG